MFPPNLSYNRCGIPWVQGSAIHSNKRDPHTHKKYQNSIPDSSGGSQFGQLLQVISYTAFHLYFSVFSAASLVLTMCLDLSLFVLEEVLPSYCSISVITSPLQVKLVPEHWLTAVKVLLVAGFKRMVTIFEGRVLGRYQMEAL